MMRSVGYISLVILLLSGCGSSEQSVVVEAEVVGCDAAQRRCQLEVDGHMVSLSLQPGLVPLKPFSVSAEIENSNDVKQVILDFQMLGMEMGPNRYRLLAVEGAWQGTATLPVCTTSRSDWLAIMTFQRGTKSYSLSFPFTTQ